MACYDDCGPNESPIDTLIRERDAARAEAERLRAEVDRLREVRDRLREGVERLQRLEATLLDGVVLRAVKGRGWKATKAFGAFVRAVEECLAARAAAERKERP